MLEMANLATWISVKHKLGQGQLKVKIICMIKLCVWLSIGKWEVGLQLKDILVQMFLISRIIK